MKDRAIEISGIALDNLKAMVEENKLNNSEALTVCSLQLLSLLLAHKKPTTREAVWLAIRENITKDIKLSKEEFRAKYER